MTGTDNEWQYKHVKNENDNKKLFCIAQSFENIARELNDKMCPVVLQSANCKSWKEKLRRKYISKGWSQKIMVSREKLAVRKGMLEKEINLLQNMSKDLLGFYVLQ